MQEPYYMRNPYLREAEASVTHVNQGKYVVLDKPLFYPNAGGQPHDTGTMTRLSDGKVFRIVFVGKFSGEISHEVEPAGLQVGNKVKCEIDWDRRYTFMRFHTGSHVLAGVIHKETGALSTGSQISPDRCRNDFAVEVFDREKLKDYEQKANEVVKEGHPVSFRFFKSKELKDHPEFFRLYKGFDPNIREVRIVDIQGFDAQACGGCHVKNTSEIGEIRIVKMENKGAKNRRIYFVLE